MKIKSVEFALENCEVLSIDGKYIGNFQVRDLKKHITKHYNSIMHMTTCELFSIAISREANKEYNAFDVEEWKHNLFERLSARDICSVDLIYEDGTKDEFYVDWVGESEYKNEAQDSYVSKLGDLYIVISKEQTVKTCFGNWNIDDENGTSHMMFR
ncbi:hypothetical protein F4V43_02070 [Paenibacillus spiritus]|uniref:Uncharacterized protein n=1 Tax=Paenibacillus spiritus TaxID=2496557 RepID=A0A5J5GGM2_9BACL|nr:hypothetical protein [Paenibacillus spiritus]KAA9007295.1 hypothetical protein F4V43_02070 [Paenibacillus spiritus]